ncbi:helix-turn-helix protein [Dyadobacter jejuensis]|uniref:Helix-turn-helix protein n=1 Tax=Dyadobacter jejuensis TaxID=1082580 RepID=A0A316A8X1_9BACT|nr:helix-turn-helix domain-containing protein [Dyadobacter jejuensis]PWJ54083.1 helix-turn-helix protein [Dyadobacter jejuensis]
MDNILEETAGVILFIILLYFIIIYLFYWKRQKKKSVQNEKWDIMSPTNLGNPAQMENEDQISNIDEECTRTLTAEVEENRLIPIQKEKLLLMKLDEFEQSGIFLENNFSLAIMATWMGINTKYLSYLIRNHRDTTFNNYINQLRIEYIVGMLKVDAKCRQYKISVLASMSGFSSHSHFATVFRAQTGESPSSFIGKLVEEEADWQ